LTDHDTILFSNDGQTSIICKAHKKYFSDNLDSDFSCAESGAEGNNHGSPLGSLLLDVANHAWYNGWLTLAMVLQSLIVILVLLHPYSFLLHV
jgi:hypothetical protein